MSLRNRTSVLILAFNVVHCNCNFVLSSVQYFYFQTYLVFAHSIALLGRSQCWGSVGEVSSVSPVRALIEGISLYFMCSGPLSSCL
jgi:hypothetical protein